jgi:hypothetical protein
VRSCRSIHTSRHREAGLPSARYRSPALNALRNHRSGREIPEVKLYRLSEAGEVHRLSQSGNFRGKLAFQVR